MPAFTLTPEEIFANKIALFDINFFDPMPPTEVQRPMAEIKEVTFTEKNIFNDILPTELETLYDEVINNAYWQVSTSLDIMYSKIDNFPAVKYILEMINAKQEEETGGLKVDFNSSQYLLYANDLNRTQRECEIQIVDNGIENSGYMYTINLTYSENNIATLKIDQHNFTEEIREIKVETDIIESTAEQLQKIVASWYFILRNLALLVLMIVLIYVGIRIAMGSTAGEKAKYKERITDWLVAVCLLFILQYIMVFSIGFAERLTNLVDSIDNSGIDYLKVPLTDNQMQSIDDMQNDSSPENSLAYAALMQNGDIHDGVDEEGNPQKELWWKTDIMGKMKVKAQIVGEGRAKWVGYSLCYMILVLFTLFFSWTYLKRVVYMAFLTIIAPLVAMTYPIDKIIDGRAQAFEMWLKEYIFNLLIQPLHLLLYTVLVSAAYELASTNPVYAVVAIGFMIPAEKLVRRFFGFTKAQIPGALGGAAGAALAFSGLQKIMRFGSKKGSRKDSDKNEKENDKINFSSSEGVNAKSAVASEVLGKDGKLAKTQTKAGGDGKGNAPTDQNSEGKEGSTTQIRLNKNALESGKDNAAEKTSEEYKNWLAKTGTRLKQSKLGKSTIRGARTIRVGVGAYARGLGKKMTRRVNKARPIRALARGVAGAYGATALGMAGLAIGAASGDPSKAFQYGTAGLAGGYSVGKGLAEKGMDALSVNSSEIKEAMEMTWAGDEYGKRKVEQRKEELVRDEGSISYLMQTMGVSRSEAKEILRITGGECIDNNISDKADIAAIHKMVNDGTSIESAIAAQKFSGYLPRDLDKMGAEEREDRIRQWANEYEEEGYDDPTYLANEHMKLVEKFIKARSSLKKA